MNQPQSTEENEDLRLRSMSKTWNQCIEAYEGELQKRKEGTSIFPYYTDNFLLDLAEKFKGG